MCIASSQVPRPERRSDKSCAETVVEDAADPQHPMDAGGRALTRLVARDELARHVVQHLIEVRPDERPSL
jgi:hypothetical protein